MIVRFLTFLILIITQVTFDAPAPKPSRSVLVVGDSLGVGLGGTLQALGKTDGDKVTVEAIVGTNTCQWAGKIDDAIKRNKPTDVLVSLGTNDAAAGKDWVVRNSHCYSDFSKSVKSSGAKLLWILPPTLPARMEEGRKASVSESTKVADRTFDSTPITSGRAPDGVHYTPQGYKAWAEKVWAWSK